MDFNFLFALSCIHFSKEGFRFCGDACMFPLTGTLIGRMNSARIDVAGLSGANGEAHFRPQKACCAAFLTHRNTLFSAWRLLAPAARD